jgi:hypothetical protein
LSFSVFSKPNTRGGRGGNGYTLFNFRVSFATNVYHQIRDGKKLLIKEVAIKEEKASLSPALVAC